MAVYRPDLGAEIPRERRSAAAGVVAAGLRGKRLDVRDLLFHAALLLTLGLNIASERFVRRVRRRY